MTHARDVGRDFDPVGETDTGDLAESRVRLLRRRGVDARADAALLRARLEGRRLRLVLDALAALRNKLIDRWHSVLILLKTRTAENTSRKGKPAHFRRGGELCQARTSANGGGRGAYSARSYPGPPPYP